MEYISLHTLGFSHFSFPEINLYWAHRNRGSSSADITSVMSIFTNWAQMQEDILDFQAECPDDG